MKTKKDGSLSGEEFLVGIEPKYSTETIQGALRWTGTNFTQLGIVVFDDDLVKDKDKSLLFMCSGLVRYGSKNYSLYISPTDWIVIVNNKVTVLSDKKFNEKYLTFPKRCCVGKEEEERPLGAKDDNGTSIIKWDGNLRKMKDFIGIEPFYTLVNNGDLSIITKNNKSVLSIGDTLVKDADGRLFRLWNDEKEGENG